MSTRPFRLALLVASIAASSNAAWVRNVYTGVGARSDSPQPHSLDYYRVHPCLRTDPKDRIIDCSSEQSREVRIETNLVGKIQGYSIFDLDFFFPGGEERRLGPDLKAILVQTRQNEYHEIYVIERNEIWGEIRPSRIESTERIQLLVTRYYDGGNKGAFGEDYFIFGETGPIRLDPEPVFKAAAGVLPKGIRTWPPMSKFTFSEQIWEVGANGEHNALCCDGGKVTVRFRIDPSGRFVILYANYDQNSSFYIERE